MLKPKLNKHSSLEVMVADHCNLNCKSCDHCSPILEPWLYNLEKFKSDLTIIKKNFRSLKLIKFLGGEPFLNKDLLDFVIFTRKLYPHAKLQILTNGTILPQDSDYFWKVINKLRVKIIISWYLPIGMNRLEKYCKLAKHLHFSQVHTFFTGILFKNSTESSSYKACKLKDNCSTLRDGMLYRCSEGYSCKRLVELYGFNYPLNNICINLREGLNKNICKDFKKSEPSQCKYCTYPIRKDFRDKWSASEKKIEEWVVDNESAIQ